MLALLCLSSVSCSSPEDNARNSVTQAADGKLSCSGIQDATINGSARKYYENIVKAAYATDALQQDTASNPIAERMADISIEKENGEKCFVKDLGSEEQKKFLDSWAKVQAYELSQKIAQEPGREDAIIQQNDAVDKAFATLGVDAETRAGGTGKVDARKLFGLVRSELEKDTTDTQASMPQTRGCLSTDDDVNPTAFQNGLSRYSTRGDLIVSLPMDGASWLPIGYSKKYKGLKMGHVGFISASIRGTDNPQDTRFVLAADINGVNYETLDWWNIRSYIMGLRRTTWKWSWRRGLYKEYNNLSQGDMERCLDYATRFLGTPYCADASFVIAKWVAPRKFVCSTLLWYAIKQIHGIDVSAWWNPTMVSPGDIYNSEYTYTKGHIQ